MTSGSVPICPRCGSSDSVVREKKFFVTLGICVIVLFAAVAFWNLFIGVAGMVLGGAILGFAPYGRLFRQCKQCRKVWIPRGQA